MNTLIQLRTHDSVGIKNWALEQSKIQKRQKKNVLELKRKTYAIVYKSSNSNF